MAKIRGPRLNSDVRVALAEATAAARANGTLINHRINGAVHARQTVATIRNEHDGEIRDAAGEALEALDRLLVCLREKAAR